MHAVVPHAQVEFDTRATRKGPERAAALLRGLFDRAHVQRIRLPHVLNTPYWNTIGVTEQATFAGDLEIERRIGAAVRWNALAMVARANQETSELGGHIAARPRLPQ